jgi:hypothetical protein
MRCNMSDKKIERLEDRREQRDRRVLQKSTYAGNERRSRSESRRKNRDSHLVES